MRQAPERLLARLPMAGASLLFAVSATASAAQIQSLRVTREDESYIVHLRVTLDVPAAAAYSVFANPANLPIVNPAVQIAQMQPESNELFTQVRVCAALFCKTLHQTQKMHYAARSDGGHMDADVVPERSDFKSGNASWEFQADGAAATALTFDARVEPAFWIPPLIGPYLVERSMRQEAERTSAGIEQLAKAQAGRAPGRAPPVSSTIMQ